MMETMSQMNHLTLKVHEGVIHPLIMQTIMETVAVVDKVQLALKAILQVIQIMGEMARVNTQTEIIISTMDIQYQLQYIHGTIPWHYGSSRTPLQPHA